MLWIWLAVWLPLTYLLHTAVLHEGSHWLAFRAFGVRARIYLLPKRLPNGAIQWARTVPIAGAAISYPRGLVISAAPVITELVWLSVALAVARAWPWASLETIPALIDLGVWWAGYLRNRPLTDGARVRQALS